MYGYEIREILKKFPEIFQRLKGIVPIDKIPRNLRRMEYLIVNEGDSNSQGIHWFVIFRDFEGFYDIFDSLGECKKCFISRKVQ